MIFISDIHGKFDKFIDLINNFNSEILIQVGDFGIGFRPTDTEYLTDINDNLKEHNNTLYVIRGNHDDPNWFEILQHSLHDYSNIIFPKECSIHEIQGYKVFFCGGGASLDKKVRQQGLNWWVNEVIDITDLDYNAEFDICVTHAILPHLVPLTIKFNVSDEIAHYIKTTEYDPLEQIYKVIRRNNCKYWVFGHWHQRVSYIDLETNIQYYCEPELGVREIR